MRLYGFTKIMSFYCICYGTKGWFFHLIFGKKDRKFHFYSGHVTAEEILHNNQNTHPKWWFIGILINNTNKGYLRYEELIRE